MTYKLANGETEGDYLGFLQFAETIEPQTAIESYLASSFQPKKGGTIPSPRTVNSMEVAPSTAAELVSGAPTVLAPAISSYLSRQQGIEPSDEPEIRRMIGAEAASAVGIGGMFLLLWLALGR